MGDVIEILTTATNTVEVEAQGPQGIPGVGVPTGGSALQVLRKKTSTDYDTEWAAAGSGSGSVTSVALASTDLTISGSPITDSGTITANIAANAVTLEKLQTISSQHLLGRHGSGNGGVQQIGLGTGLAMSGSNVGVTFGSSAGTACQGNDSRLSDSRQPLSHAASHASAGSDPLAPSDIGLGSTDNVTFNEITAAKWTGPNLVSNILFDDTDLIFQGSFAQFDCPITFGNVTYADDSRTNLGLEIGTDVAAASHGHGNLSSDGKIGSTAGLPVVTTTSGAVTTLALGTANQVLRVNSGATGVEFADPAASGVTGAAASASDVLGVSGSNITGVDANADRIVYWNNTSNKLAYGTPADAGAAAASHTHAASDVTSGTFDNARINFAAPSAIGSTTRSSGAFTSLSSSQGTITASSPVTIAATWNNGAAQFNALDVSISNTDSLAASTFITLRAGASGLTSMASITRSGAAFFGQGTVSIGDGANSIVLYNAGTLSFSSGGGVSANASTGDTILRRDAANTLAMYNTSNAQAFRLYSTFTSTTNFERLNIAAQTGGNFIVGTEKGSGGGTARGLELRTDNVARITIGSAGQLGFFGATAAAQPTAVADATDAATVITQLNALLSRMRTLGLIAT